MSNDQETSGKQPSSQYGQASQDSQQIDVTFAADLDYKYRDVLNIFVGRGDVVFELGNIHRSVPNQATIADRVVVSMATAYDFHQRLGQALKDAQEQLQKDLARNRG